MVEPMSDDDRASRRDANLPGRCNRILVFVMLGVIVLFIVAFLLFRPDPSGAGHTTGPATGHPTTQR